MADETVRTDFDVAFTEGTTLVDEDGTRWQTRVVSLGEIPIGTGAVAVGDPIESGLDATRPPSGTLAPGNYPFELALAETLDASELYEQGTVQSSAARIRFGEGSIASWVRASVNAEIGYGACAFSDAEWKPEVEEQDRFEDEFDDTAEIAPGVTAARFVTDEGRTVLAATAGDGEGTFVAYWGMNEVGEPVAFCVDFSVLVTEHRDWAELPWPLERGDVHNDVLRRHDITAKVPWLSATKLHLDWPKKAFVTTRWRLPDGTLVRSKEEREGTTSVVDLSNRPEGAHLAVRIFVEELPMRVLERPGHAYR